MTNRSALITGGSAGIGLAIATMLVDEGWSVTLVGRDQDKLDEAATGLSTSPSTVRTISANLAHDVAADLVGKHVAWHGGMDLLVSNAGVGFVGRLEDRMPKALDLEISLNLRAAIRLLQESLTALRESAGIHGSSYVVNVSSMTAVETPPFATVYSATKAALVAFSRSAHAELSPEGIHVTALVPGFVDTPGTGWAPESAREAMISSADVAEAVRFLLRTSSTCFLPEIQMTSRGSGLHELVDWASYA